MANFSNKGFKTEFVGASTSASFQDIDSDNYMTPFSAWEDIRHLIPNDKVIWEAFYGDGQSGNHLETLGFNVINQDINFFSNNLGDIVVSNPPFSKYKDVLERLVELQKPFILIMPSSKINTQFVRGLFMEQVDKLQIIIPKKRIQFLKLVDGKIDTSKKSANFDCFYYCWKINLPRDITWLD